MIFAAFKFQPAFDNHESESDSISYSCSISWSPSQVANDFTPCGRNALLRKLSLSMLRCGAPIHPRSTRSFLPRLRTSVAAPTFLVIPATRDFSVYLVPVMLTLPPGCWGGMERAIEHSPVMVAAFPTLSRGERNPNPFVQFSEIHLNSKKIDMDSQTDTVQKSNG